MDKTIVLQQIINHYTGGSKKQFAQKIGVTPQAISAWFTRNTYDVDLLLTKCEMINPSFLLTGEGEMLLSQHDKTGVTEQKEHNDGKKNITMDDRTLDRLLDALDRIVEQGRKNQEQFDRVLALFDRVLTLQERAEHPDQHLRIGECRDA